MFKKRINATYQLLKPIGAEAQTSFIITIKVLTLTGDGDAASNSPTFFSSKRYAIYIIGFANGLLIWYHYFAGSSKYYIATHFCLGFLTAGMILG